MEFVDIKQDDLLKLRDGLEILDRLRDPAFDDRGKVYFYGVSTDVVVLDAAREAIAEYADDPAITEDSITLGEVAVCLPISGDVIYALTGSGMKLDSTEDEFAYRTGTEGPRILSFRWSRVKPVVTVADFTKMALANDSVYLDRYLAQRGTNTPGQIKKEVKRENPATASPLVPPVQKQTSLKVSDLLEAWLG
jgi:hypothetical protein